MHWKESDSYEFQQYHKETSGALINELRSRVPKLKGKTIESVALESKKKEGFEEAIQFLEDLLIKTPKVTDGANNGFINLPEDTTL